MGVITLTGGENDEQALGPLMHAAKLRVYAQAQQSPLNLFAMTGHRINDAPEYETVEAKIAPRYRVLNNVNVVEDEQIVGETIKSTSLNIDLPGRAVTQADQIRRLQTNGFKFNYGIVPLGCPTKCDEIFEIIQAAEMGAIRKTSGLVNYGDDADVITRQATVKGPGDFLKYLGLQQRLLRDFTTVDLYAITELFDDCVANVGCPWQSWIVGGTAGYLATTRNKFGSMSVITTTTITNDVAAAVITDVEVLPGNQFVIAYAATPNGVSPTGGLAYSANGAAAVLATMPGDKAGVQALVAAYGKVFAFGNAGKIWQSCDNGFTWTTVVSPISGSDTILDATFDPSRNMIYIATDAPELWQYDGATFTNITTKLGSVGAVDFTAVWVQAPDHVAVGTSGGTVYDLINASSVTPQVFASSLGANAVADGVGDGRVARTLAGSSTRYFTRDFITKQSFQQSAALPGNVTRMAGGRQQDGEGLNFVLVAEASGHLYSLESCFPCLTAAC